MMPANLSIILSRTFKVIVALAGLVALLSWSSVYFANRAVITGVTDEFYRFSAENPVDVLIVGNSHSQCDINTLMLSKRLNASVYTLAGPAQTLGLTRYALEDALRFTRPRMVLIDAFFIGEPEIIPGREQFAYEQINVMRSLDIRTACVHDLLPEVRYFEAAFPVIGNHDNWKDPDAMHRNQLYQYGGATLDKNRYYNGFTPQSSVMEPETYAKLQSGAYENRPPVPERSWEYVQEIISLCRSSGAEPVFIQLPLLDAYNRNTGYDQWADELSAEAASRDVPFLDFNRTDSRSALGLLPQDFMNELTDIGNNHLNINGANKLTAVLAETLNTRYKSTLSSCSGPILTAPSQMLRLLKTLKSDDLVFLSVRDNAATGWLPEETALLRQHGLKALPEGFWGDSYAAIFTGDGTVLLEKRSSGKIDEAYEKGQLLNGVALPAPVQLISAGINSGPPEARILLDGFDYSFNYRGLNVAIFNRTDGRVRAVEQFDLYDRSLILEGLLKP